MNQLKLDAYMNQNISHYDLGIQIYDNNQSQLITLNDCTGFQDELTARHRERQELIRDVFLELSKDIDE